MVGDASGIFRRKMHLRRQLFHSGRFRLYCFVDTIDSRTPLLAALYAPPNEKARPHTCSTGGMIMLTPCEVREALLVRSLPGDGLDQECGGPRTRPPAAWVLERLQIRCMLTDRVKPQASERRGVAEEHKLGPERSQRLHLVCEPDPPAQPKQCATAHTSSRSASGRWPAADNPPVRLPVCRRLSMSLHCAITAPQPLRLPTRGVLEDTHLQGSGRKGEGLGLWKRCAQKKGACQERTAHGFW